LVTAAHPGYASTNLQNHMSGAALFNFLLAQPQWKGALPTLRAAVDADATNGDYFGPKGLGEWRGWPVKVESNKASHNEADAKRLWDISEKSVGFAYSWDR
jgi:hypothetical protein